MFQVDKECPYLKKHRYIELRDKTISQCICDPGPELIRKCIDSYFDKNTDMPRGKVAMAKCILISYYEKFGGLNIQGNGLDCPKNCGGKNDNRNT